ncbi:MAG: hypothetical protein R2748_01425 [Bryobacterales bacterium]
MRRRSKSSLEGVIRNGVPAAGMPGFDLPDATIAGLADLVIALNASAADSQVAGDVEAGKRSSLARANAEIATWSRARARQSGLTCPPLRQANVGELRESLLEPGTQIAAATIWSEWNCRTARRCAVLHAIAHVSAWRCRFAGRIHPLSLDSVAQITDETLSAMPRTRASEAELQNLLAYLSRRTGVTAESTPRAQRKKPADSVSFEQILDPKPHNWLHLQQRRARQPLQQTRPDQPRQRGQAGGSRPVRCRCGSSSCPTRRTTRTCATSAWRRCR